MSYNISKNGNYREEDKQILKEILNTDILEKSQKLLQFLTIILQNILVI